MDLLNFANHINALEVIIGGFVIVIIGGVASYFLIKYQVNKNLQDTINIYKGEILAMGVKISRLQEEMIAVQKDNDGLKKENATLKFKKNYLKDLVMQALASKKSIDKSLIEEMLKNQK